jgi:hypothetical protein
LKQEWQKSSARTRQTDRKNMVWFGEIERKSGKLSMLPLLTVLPLNYFMDRTEENIRTLALSQTTTQSTKKEQVKKTFLSS